MDSYRSEHKNLSDFSINDGRSAENSTFLQSLRIGTSDNNQDFQHERKESVILGLHGDISKIEALRFHSEPKSRGSSSLRSSV